MECDLNLEFLKLAGIFKEDMAGGRYFWHVEC